MLLRKLGISLYWIAYIKALVADFFRLSLKFAATGAAAILITINEVFELFSPREYFLGESAEIKTELTITDITVVCLTIFITYVALIILLQLLQNRMYSRDARDTVFSGFSNAFIFSIYLFFDVNFAISSIGIFTESITISIFWIIILFSAASVLLILFQYYASRIKGGVTKFVPKEQYDYILSNITKYIRYTLHIGKTYGTNYNYNSIKCKYSINKRGDTFVEQDYEIQVLSRTLSCIFINCTGDELSDALDNFSEMNFHVESNTLGVQIESIAVLDSPKRKQIMLYFNPPAEVGQIINFKIEYIWPGFLKQLQIQGKTCFFWDFTAYQPEKNCDLFIQMKFEREFGEVLCVRRPIRLLQEKRNKIEKEFSDILDLEQSIFETEVVKGIEFTDNGYLEQRSEGRNSVWEYKNSEAPVGFRRYTLAMYMN